MLSTPTNQINKNTKSKETVLTLVVSSAELSALKIYRGHRARARELHE